jgi:hypothetical protein
MMGGGAFILLKAGRRRPESTKQAEAGLAGLLKILRICRFWRRNPSHTAAGTCNGCIDVGFCRIWLIRGEISGFVI